MDLKSNISSEKYVELKHLDDGQTRRNNTAGLFVTGHEYFDIRMLVLVIFTQNLNSFYHIVYKTQAVDDKEQNDKSDR